MKKTFLAVLMAGSSIAIFAQTTPTTPTTPPATPTTPTTSTTTTTNTTTDPLKTTTNTELNSNANNTITASTSTSWAPGTSPYWGWNSYGIWNSNAYPYTNNGYNNATSMNNGNLSSTGAYSAYGTSIAALPPNVQMNFSRDFPNSANQAYSWSQYGDWFHTQYMSNGRSLHYYYDMRGNGYALALPVVQTYVPEDVIDKALNKYGSNLYSISMVKTAEGNNAYQLGLIERGQVRMEYLNEDGSTVTNVWRTEEVNNSTMNTTDVNSSIDTQNLNSANTTTGDVNATINTDANTKSKTKIKNADGTKTKIKVKDGKTKVKTIGTPDQHMEE